MNNSNLKIATSTKDAEEQIGSVFAVQGIDLNNVGVLIGNDLQVHENGRLFGKPENFHKEVERYRKL